MSASAINFNFLEPLLKLNLLIPPVRASAIQLDKFDVTLNMVTFKYAYHRFK